MKKSILRTLILTLLLVACGKEETKIEQGEVPPIVYESEEVKLCQYKGLTLEGVSTTYEPTEEEIDTRFAELCMFAMETTGNPYEHSNAWVAENFTGMTTLAEVRAACRESLISEYESDAPYLNRKAAFEYVVEHSEVTPNKETIQAAEERLLAMHKEDANTVGYTSFTKYLEDVGYESEEEFLKSEFFQEEVNTALELSLVAKAIAENEGLTVSEEEVQALVTANPNMPFMDEESVRNHLLEQAAIDFVFENTIFTIEEATEGGETKQ